MIQKRDIAQQPCPALHACMDGWLMAIADRAISHSSLVVVNMSVHVSADLLTGLQNSTSSDGPFAEVGGWFVGVAEEQSIVSSCNALLSPGRLAGEDIAADLGAHANCLAYT